MSCTTSSATARPYSVKLVCRTWEQQALRNHHMVLSPFSWPTLPAESTCNLKCTLKPPRKDKSKSLRAIQSPVTATEGGPQARGLGRKRYSPQGPGRGESRVRNRRRFWLRGGTRQWPPPCTSKCPGPGRTFPPRPSPSPASGPIPPRRPLLCRGSCL